MRPLPMLTVGRQTAVTALPGCRPASLPRRPPRREGAPEMTAQPFAPLRSSAVTRRARRPSEAGMATPLLRWARKGGITVAGIGIIAAGVAMLVLPGPGV